MSPLFNPNHAIFDVKILESGSEGLSQGLTSAGALSPLFNPNHAIFVVKILESGSEGLSHELTSTGLVGLVPVTTV